MTRYGAVDIGTNSTRLLVAEVDAATGALKTLDRRMTITRLGQGVGQTGKLHPDALTRTLAVLDRYGEALREFGVDRVRVTATSAARDAANRDELFGPATKVLGVTPELLSGQEEGRLTYLGATTGLDHTGTEHPGPYLVVDIGGGSTEFIIGPNPQGEAAGAISVDIGCVRLTEAYLHSDPPAPEELSQAISVVQAYLDDVDRDLPTSGAAQTMIGVAGTVTTVAAVEIGLPEYDADVLHHFRLTKAAAEDVFRTLATERAADRRYNPGLEPERVDVIVGGAAILVAVLRHFGVDEMLVSEADILDGLIRSQL